jgi:hypothetical protein
LTDVLNDERSHLARHRERDSEAVKFNPTGALIGLSLSGGGIRSATFSLGVMQALAHRKLLRRFDYLSTVSGGGYIGCWLSSILERLHRTGCDDPIGTVEQIIAPREIRTKDEEPTEIRFLRAYSNYLTPRLGLLSADTLALVTGFACNLTLNLSLAVLSIALLLSLLHIFMFAASLLASAPSGVLIAVIIGAAFFAGVACYFAAMLLTLQSQDLRQIIKGNQFLNFLPQTMRSLALRFFHYELQRSPQVLVLLPLICSIILAGIWPGLPDLIANSDFFILIIITVAITGTVLFMFGGGTLITYALLQIVSGFEPTILKNPRRVRKWILRSFIFGALNAVGDGGSAIPRFVTAALFCATAGFGLMWLIAPVMTGPAPVIVFQGPVLLAGVVCILYVIWVGVTGNTYSEFSREWLSRLFGTLLGVSAVWAFTGAVIVYARPVFYWLFARVPLISAVSETFVLALMMGVFLFVWLRPRFKDTTSTTLRGQQTQIWGTVACVVIVAIFSAVLTLGFQEILRALTPHSIERPASGVEFDGLRKWHVKDLCNSLSMYCEGSVGVNWLPSLSFVHAIPAGVAILAWFAFYYVDINTFSLQNLYRNRLVRCYLGAAKHEDRLENPYAGFDPSDDLPLASLANQRPYHLINTALNINQGEDLAWQQRKATSFLFSPNWCGFRIESTEGSAAAMRHSHRGGYAKTMEFVPEPSGFGRNAKGVMLGTAMATSGAAVSSQMGFASNSLRAFVLTLLNFRLGRWFPNPGNRSNRDNWKLQSPRYSAYWYLKELLGTTNEKSDWVYLSDGGHFENLGIYELVRRRCRFIVSVDAGADPQLSFGDLGNAVRKCRVDFGVDVVIDLKTLTPTAANKQPLSASVIGTIKYPPSGKSPECKGYILYIKPCIPNKGLQLPPDILSYCATHPEYPHQPTTDQWFTEAQFESYRQLGFLIAMDSLGKIETRQILEDIAKGVATDL